MNEKTCPLKTINGIMFDQDTDDAPEVAAGRCTGAGCAWWIESGKYEGCAVKVLARRQE